MLGRSAMSTLQEAEYGAGRDYAHGSPHLTHRRLRERVESNLVDLVRDQIARHGRCLVLDVGAGHGTFAQALVAAGADVTVTEMSAPSADFLRTRFAGVPEVKVVHDPDAAYGPPLVEEGCELVVFISVLHHIPDYLATVRSLVERLPEGAAFYSTQDPLWYADRSRASLAASRASYLVWRVRQGDLRRGVSTTWRRLRGVHDPGNPADMVEYHVVRDGVDEKALGDLLRAFFADVRVTSYWATQSPALQRVGERARLRSDFSIRATGRLGTSA